MSDLMISIENVSKEYKLGQIGGTTLRDELQRKKAKILKREDPTKRIGSKNYNAGETFYALSNISIKVKKGESLGIIGHNGAGKSTLLKLLSRVTAPSEGEIGLNGRVASMLEVGTGFHPELTGRENVYMNGAILGMTKKEIDSKIEDIIEFSECRQFIDTPVKRYSSGMYVKLAFSVAAHLDSEILIMDEVLAVGDMAFQKKCLDKMRSAAKNEGRTVLYVSHNMSTIRQLCDRCVVLNKGKVVFDGNVEEAIMIYTNNQKKDLKTDYDFTAFSRPKLGLGESVYMRELHFLDHDSTLYKSTELINVLVKWSARRDENVRFGLSVKYFDGSPAGFAESLDEVKAKKGQDYESKLKFDLTNLAPGQYILYLEPYCLNDFGSSPELDRSLPMAIEIIEGRSKEYQAWQREYWGNTRLNNISAIHKIVD